MAEVRLTPSLPAVAPATPARANEAVRAAQRAFFDAALNASQTAAPARPVAKAAATAAAPAPPQKTGVLPQEGAGAPARGLRPGSLLDIRV